VTAQTEAVWIFIGAGVLVVALFAWVILSACHARNIDMRNGLRRKRNRENTLP